MAFDFDPKLDDEDAPVAAPATAPADDPRAAWMKTLTPIERSLLVNYPESPRAQALLARMHVVPAVQPPQPRRAEPTPEPGRAPEPGDVRVGKGPTREAMRRGGLKGGRLGGTMRARRMTAEERSAAARKAVLARWARRKGA